MDFFQSEKGGRKLVRDGYMYHKNTTLRNGSTYWECCERRSGNGCKAKVTLDPNDVFVGQSAPHTHPPYPEKIEAQKSRSRMKRDARISNARTNNVVAANMAGANDAVLAQLPSLETMRRDVRRNRQVHQGLPEVPDRGNHLFVIPHPFDETTTGERFLHYDNNREARMLIFGTRRSFDHLANSNHWFMDGTFSTVPFQFSQLYTVHGLNQGRNAVGAYCLLPDKRANTYVEMLTEIHTLANEVIPESVMIDFEQGMIPAWAQVFPLSPIKGCLFHLSKSIYRKVQSEGLAERYMNDEEFRQNIRMLSALSFVPVDDTIVAFEQLANHCGDAEQIILDYFETNYIGEVRRGRRMPPRFPHAMWNMNIRVLDQLPRTNNNLEGGHNRFSQQMI